MNGMHTHVIKTTTDKLEDELDLWLTTPDPRSAEPDEYSVHHMGGRDWAIVLRHREHSIADEARPNSTPGGVSRPGRYAKDIVPGMVIWVPEPGVAIDGNIYDTVACVQRLRTLQTKDGICLNIELRLPNQQVCNILRGESEVVPWLGWVTVTVAEVLSAQWTGEYTTARE